jgi:hypothetical protein
MKISFSDLIAYILPGRITETTENKSGIMFQGVWAKITLANKKDVANWLASVFI